MALTIATALSERLGLPTVCLATLWVVTRTDGTIFRFTDHDQVLTFEGNTYTPVGGFDASATQLEGGMKDTNRELVGVLSSAAITHDDLRAGLYDDAVITEHLIDWSVPFAGAIETRTYEVGTVEFDGEVWVASILGISSKLQRASGDVYVRTCRTDLYSTDLCKVTKATYKESGTVSAITTQRLVFTTSVLGAPAKADDWFNYGEIEWTSGNNDGLKGEVKDYTQTGSIIELQLATPFDIQVGDGFDVYAGCDRQASTCKDKFSNLVNFRGFHFIPGLDATMTTPESK